MLLERLEHAFIERTPKSKLAHERACKVTPGGVHSNFRNFGPHPISVAHAEGTRLWDVDGNEYIDFTMGFGCLMAGHAHPKVVEAVQEAVTGGTIYAIPHERSALLAEEILKRYPFMDQVRFTNSGSETTMHAVRLARGHTGRELLVKIDGGYHGSHDPVMVWADEGGERDMLSAGVSEKALASLITVPFNDLGAVEAVFKVHPNAIAALILEPVMMNIGIIPPDEGYLHQLLDLCRCHGALLIFDEVKTGAKLAYGGACEYYNIQPDIVCLAKSIGTGVPLGAFVSTKEIMGAIERDEVFHTGTYNANPISMAAGLVTLKEVLTRNVYEKTFDLNRQLVEGCNRIIRDHDLPAVAVGIGPNGNIYFLKDTEGVPLEQRARHFAHDHNIYEAVDQRMAKAYLLGMLEHGIIPVPFSVTCCEQWTISIQHTQADINRHLKAFADVAVQLKGMVAGKVSV